MLLLAKVSLHCVFRESPQILCNQCNCIGVILYGRDVHTVPYSTAFVQMLSVYDTSALYVFLYHDNTTQFAVYDTVRCVNSV